MPTVLRIDGYEVRIYSRDHQPRHVHVMRAGNEVVIDIDSISVRDPTYMSVREVRRALEIVAENQAFLQSEWDRIKPDS